ncbi:hypothetical protein IV454_17890 [Massilia antarctica]|uniref:Uncharacterized protein n=1 Tax=Massilia antarctica TaxID=2765360 RepID=A0AA48W8H0_9BURK|nr:hypothetical protein [Massilia antarctica]QPI47481.1 hypothetical protein IV454_17890 [Massilia antarctica]
MKLLKPLSVPWMISPSVPRLTLFSEEDGKQLVKFCGFFGFEDPGTTAMDSIIVDDGSLLVNPNEVSARYQLISLQFEGVGWLRRSPQYSDREVIQESDYDWSCVGGLIRENEDVGDWLIRTQQEWTDTRTCSNPGAYIVENSDWDVGLEKTIYNLKHFLILGDSVFIEILAQDCSWLSEGNLSR